MTPQNPGTPRRSEEYGAGSGRPASRLDLGNFLKGKLGKLHHHHPPHHHRRHRNHGHQQHHHPYPPPHHHHQQHHHLQHHHINCMVVIPELQKQLNMASIVVYFVPGARPRSRASGAC